ncbi:hypothetical protein LtaPh_2307800 [Leishmania tarentolae]|uniref:Uncharacterized protein n=1 Tax=Leishmania tarentolae TaxID=5689 RepID=A0A640KGW9_LEITA|nr:hypothetical protein LtaPh_2307800 [Leishmania tarentolae]
MNDSSLLSGLSSIGDAIGETAYGRCVSFFVISCEPLLNELAVRLGGPGCPWETVQLPMQQPILLRRHPGVLVARRATELAFATKSHVESLTSSVNDLHPTCSMVAMDILTGTAISAAASTLTTYAGPTAPVDVPVTVLTATTEAQNAVSDAEGSHSASPSPLRVCFYWGIGETLLEFNQPATDTARTEGGDDAPGENKASDRENEERESENDRKGDEGKDYSSNDVGTNSELPAATAPAVATAVSTAHEERVMEVQGDHGEQTAPAVSARFSSPLFVNLLSSWHDNSASEVMCTADDNSASGTLKLQKDGHSVAICGRPSPPRSSKTPRRQRPENYRSTMIHMEMAPDMVTPPQEAGERHMAKENLVKVSKDDNEGAENMASAVVHFPSSPSAKEMAQPLVAYRALEEVAPETNMMTPVQLRNEAERSCSTAVTRLLFNNETDDDLDHKRQAAPGCDEPNTAAVVKASARPQPTADNLFEGADGAALIVTVGVVAIYNTNGTADPHRIVSVEISATPDDAETMHHSESHSFALSFRTTPTLRGLAASVPQVSSPVLLLSRYQNDRNGATHSDDTGVVDANPVVLPALHATCILTENVALKEEITSGNCASTTLWTSVADVAPVHVLQSLSAHPLAPAPLMSHEVRFTGANSDAVLTRWTYMTVSAYRDAVLNLRSRVTETNAQPVLQLLLIDESPSRTRKTKMSSCQNLSTATVWVSSSSSLDSTRVDSIAHRVVAVSSTYDIVQQPLSVPVWDPLVYVAVQLSGPTSSSLPAQPIFLRLLSDTWTRLEEVSSDVGIRDDSSSSATAVLYYRFVDSSTATAAVELSSLPAPLRETPRGSNKSSEDTELREVTIMVNPPATFLPALPPSTGSHTNTGVSAAASEADAACRSTSAWKLVLRHAGTHAVLAEASSETGVLLYHGFLPFLSDRHKASGHCGAVGTAGSANADTPPLGKEGFLPYEVLLVPAAGLPKMGQGASPPPKLAGGGMRPITTTSPARTAPTSHGSGLASQKVAKTASATPWSGNMWISSSALYSAPSTGAHWKTSICVSPTPAPLPAIALMLCSPSATLGAQLEVMCAVRSHTLGADSAVFALRSLRVVPSSVAGGVQAPPTGASRLSLSQVQLWFTTSGSNAEEVRAAWGAASVPSAKEVQHAWAPAVPASSSCCTPAMRVDTDGQVVSPGLPVLLSTTNTRARLCVALTSTVPNGTADAPAPRQCVEKVRKSVIHHYKAHASSRAKQCSNDGNSQRQARPRLTAEQMAEVFMQCVSAVAMCVDNYAEVDLSPSLVAASERPGRTRHRLLISFVTGTIRMSHHVVLELQGQWIKVPRCATVVSDTYTPSPRLWALRRSCVVRNPDPRHRAVCSRMGASEGGQLVPKALEAYLDYNVAVESVPLDYTDPSEHAVQTLLPGLLYDKLVVQMKQREARLQPYREALHIVSSGMQTASPRRGYCSAPPEETAIDHADMTLEDTPALLERIFGPTGLAHAAYVSEVSRKVAIIHFFFGDAYTTRTVLNVSCTVSADTIGAISNAPTQLYGHHHNPQQPSPGRSVPSMKKTTCCSTALSSSSVQVLCDSLTRTWTLYGSPSTSHLVNQFPGESHCRYPSELTWYHGSLNITSEEEHRRREEGETAWRQGLSEQYLGVHIKPGPFVVSAVTQHSGNCLPLILEPSLTRCADGQYYIVFGGLSPTTGATSSNAYMLDDATQMWKPLRARLRSCDFASLSTPVVVPPPRYGHTAVYRPADDAVYIFGGCSRSSGAAVGSVNDSHARDANGGSGAAAPLVYGDVWRLLWDADAGTMLATELHCTWAETPSGGTEVNESHAFSTLTGAFEGELARWRHAAVLHNDYMVVIGGQSRSGACCSCAEVLYLDIATQRWAARCSFGTEMPCPRYGLAATIVSGGSALYIFGGWGHEQSKAGKLHSAADSDSSLNSDAAGGTRCDGGAQDVVALSDFFKMDLITRMWSRVEPNGTVRPPSLELADMTSCIIDDCPVILLVGGHRNSAEVTLPTTEKAAASPLVVFLFSTATLFWRIVRMDCTPVATRFGLRAVASVASAKAPGPRNKVRSAQKANLSLVRRSLPSRGQRIGSILIVGGLPLEEAEITQEVPALSMHFAAGNGSDTANRHAAREPCGTGESPPPKQRFLTPEPPTVPRNTSMGRPMTGPARTASHKVRPPPTSRCSAAVIASGWLKTPQSMRESGDGRYEHARAAGPMAQPTTSAVAIRQLTDRLHGPASASGRVTTSATSVAPRHTSCYDTLTPSQQRRLVRRLYTQSIEIRAAHHQQLQKEVNQERTTPAFRTNRNLRCSSAAVHRAMPVRKSSAPLHHPTHDSSTAVGEGSTPSATQDTIEVNGSNGALINAGSIADVSLAGRDLQDAVLVRGSSSSSLATSSSSSSRMSRSPDSERGADVVDVQPVDAHSTALSGEDNGSHNQDANHAEKVEVGAEVSKVESATFDSNDTMADFTVTANCNSPKPPPEGEEESAVTEKESEKNASCHGSDHHFEGASSDGSSAVPQWRNAVATAAAMPAPIEIPSNAPTADVESEEAKVDDEKGDACVAPSTALQTEEVAPVARVEEGEPHMIEQQTPEEPATPPPTSVTAFSPAVDTARASGASEQDFHSDDCDDEATTTALRPPDQAGTIASPLPSIHSIPTADHHAKIHTNYNGDNLEENATTLSTPPHEVWEDENEAQPREDDDHNVDAEDDWERLSNADENDSDEDAVKTTSSAEGKSSIGKATGELREEEDLTPPPAPREHVTPPSPSSVLSLPSSKGANTVSEVAAMPAEEPSEVATPSSDASPVADVAEMPLGALAQEAGFLSKAEEADDVFSSVASSLAHAPAVAAPAVKTPATPVSPLQTSKVGDMDDSSVAASFTPAVGTPHLAAVEEDAMDEAAREQLEECADVAVEQPRAAPSTPSSTSFDAVDSAAAPPVPASSSHSRQDSSQSADGEGLQATATPLEEAVGSALTAHADSGHEDASSEAEAPIDESENATFHAVAEQQEETGSSSDESDNVAALTDHSAPATDRERGSMSAASFVVSEALEAPAVAPDSRASSVATENVDDAGAATGSLPTHDEEIEEGQDAEKLHGDSEFGEESDLQDNAEERDAAVVVAPTAAHAGEDKLEECWGPLVESVGSMESMDEDHWSSSVAAPVPASSVHNEGNSGMRTPVASQKEESESYGWEELEESAAPAAEVSEMEGTGAAWQVASVSTSPTHEEASDKGSELSSVEEEAQAQESRCPTVSVESLEDEKDDTAPRPDGVNTVELSTPGAAVSTDADGKTSAMQLNASPAKQAAMEDACDEFGTQTASEEEEEETAIGLNDGSDLLNRRRGVEVAIQDDDFDF